jgi:hypothetical protein
MHNQRKIKVSLDALEQISEVYPEYVAQVLQEVANIDGSQVDEILRWLESESEEK